MCAVCCVLCALPYSSPFSISALLSVGKTWSQRTGGKINFTPEGQSPAPDGTVWSGEWHVDTQFLNCDAEGWIYHHDWNGGDQDMARGKANGVQVRVVCVGGSKTERERQRKR